MPVVTEFEREFGEPSWPAEHADRVERATKLILSAHKAVAALEGRLGAGAVAAPELPVAYVLAVEVAE